MKYKKVTLRGHQVKAVKHTIDLWKAAGIQPDNGKTIVVMPTGAGKTMTGSAILEQWDYYQGGGRHLFLVQTKNLMYQSAKHFRLTNPSLQPISLIGDGIKNHGGKLIVAIVQSACRPNTLSVLMQIPFETVTVDECHHGVTDQHKTIIDAILTMNPRCKLLGLSATPKRFDDIGLVEVFKRVSYICQYKYMLRKGLIARPIQIHAPNSSIETMYKLWSNTCKDRKTLAFCKTKEQAWEYSKYFKNKGVSVGVITDETPFNLRVNLEKTKQVIFNVCVYVEGRDMPNVSAILLFCTPWRGRYLQMVGRGLRPDSKNCIIIGKRHHNIFIKMKVKDVLGQSREKSRSLKSRLINWLWAAAQTKETDMSKGKGYGFHADPREEKEKILDRIKEYVHRHEQQFERRPTHIAVFDQVVWEMISKWCEANRLHRTTSMITVSPGMTMWVGHEASDTVANSITTTPTSLPASSWVEQDSSAILKAKRDKRGDEDCLLIVFKNTPNTVNVYWDMWEEDIDGFFLASSPGEFYNKKIKGEYERTVESM